MGSVVAMVVRGLAIGHHLPRPDDPAFPPPVSEQPAAPRRFVNKTRMLGSALGGRQSHVPVLTTNQHHDHSKPALQVPIEGTSTLTDKPP